MRLAQRRERRRNDEHVLLLDEHAASRRRPGTVLARLLADARSLVGILIRPDVNPLVQRAELGVAGGGQWRELYPPLDPLGPALDDLLSDAGGCIV